MERGAGDGMVRCGGQRSASGNNGNGASVARRHRQDAATGQRPLVRSISLPLPCRAGTASPTWQEPRGTGTRAAWTIARHPTKNPGSEAYPCAQLERAGPLGSARVRHRGSGPCCHAERTCSAII